MFSEKEVKNAFLGFKREKSWLKAIILTVKQIKR